MADSFVEITLNWLIHKSGVVTSYCEIGTIIGKSLQLTQIDSFLSLLSFN